MNVGVKDIMNACIDDAEKKTVTLYVEIGLLR